MSTVSEQLRAKQGTKPAGTRPAGTKPATGTRPAGTKPAGARPAGAKPAAPAGGAKPAKPATPTPAPEPAAPTVKKFEGTLEEWKALTPADRAAQSDEVRAHYKELKKKAAFAALKERGKAKRAANVQARTQAMTALQAELEVGAHMFATRASYYGVEVEILGFDEKRGRNLVHVKLLTTKKGRALDEDKQGERWFSAKFLQEERPTEPYVRRRPTEVHGTEDTAEPAEDEAGVEEEEFTDETEEEGDLEGEEGDEEDEDDTEEEDGDVEDESELEEGDEEDDSESDETDASWG